MATLINLTGQAITSEQAQAAGYTIVVNPPPDIERILGRLEPPTAGAVGLFLGKVVAWVVLEAVNDGKADILISGQAPDITYRLVRFFDDGRQTDLRPVYPEELGPGSPRKFLPETRLQCLFQGRQFITKAFF